MNKGKNKGRLLSEALLSQAGEFISGCMGLYFPKGRRRELERGLRSVAPEFGFEDPEACTRWLISSTLAKSQIEILASHLEGGFLITGPSETTEALSSEFVNVNFQGGTFYKKRLMIDDYRLMIEKQLTTNREIEIPDPLRRSFPMLKV